MQQWMIYGANGYTGELIAREAVRRGHRPILAGRNAERIEPLARELGCDWRVFELRRGENAPLDGVSLVLHCAGPFLHTSEPMIDSCFAARAHYLDITGEIGVFERILQGCDVEAKERRVTLLPGVGFDVVPTDCLAAKLAARLPDATELALAFRPRGTGVSRGTMKTMIESIGDGGAIRVDGVIRRVPLAYDSRTIPFPGGERTAMTIPWGDVSTAFYTTGIPNIRVYSAASPRAIKRLRRWRWLLPLAQTRLARGILNRMASRRTGPNEQQRQTGRMELWGEVSNGCETVSMTMTTPEGYAFTVVSAVNAVERVLADPKPGAYTPAKLLGADFVESVPGVRVGDTA